MSYHCILFYGRECDGCGDCEIDHEAEQEAREIEDDRKFDEEREERLIRRYHNE